MVFRLSLLPILMLQFLMILIDLVSPAFCHCGNPMIDVIHLI